MPSLGALKYDLGTKAAAVGNGEDAKGPASALSFVIQCTTRKSTRPTH